MVQLLNPFSDKTEFYKSYPSLAAGWDVAGHPGTAPLGWDLVPGGGSQNPRWLVVFCTPEAALTPPISDPVGAVVAFDRDTDVLHVLDPEINFRLAEKRYTV